MLDNGCPVSNCNISRNFSGVLESDLGAFSGVAANNSPFLSFSLEKIKIAVLVKLYRYI